MALAGALCGGRGGRPVARSDAPAGKPPVSEAQVQAVGLDHTTVHRIWRQHGLAPHSCRQFKISTDPNFPRKARDVIGLYLDPPAQALVLSVDEKTHIQALERTQASLPLQPGQPATQTHDYIRHGTTTLCAALHVQTGQVQAQTQAKPPPAGIPGFPGHHGRRDPGARDSGQLRHTQTAAVHAWLATHPHWHFHFTPTSSSWMNAVEGLFAKLARGCMQRGHFTSLQELVDTMHTYLEVQSETPCLRRGQL